LKTAASERTVEIPRQLALMFIEHRAGSRFSGPKDYVFATRSGRPLSQRNVTRELRATMKDARLANGRLAFPVLNETDADREPVKIERDDVPSFHSFRHTAASEAIHAGDSAEEVSWLLGHKDSTVTRRVYVTEIQSVERSAKRREKMEARMGGTLSSLGSAEGGAGPNPKRHARLSDSAEVIELSGRRRTAHKKAPRP
jgi:integrase